MEREYFTSSAQALERSMYCIARSYLHCEADCEDAVQTALLRAWEKRHTLREIRYFNTWMTRILINCCKETLRRQKREMPVGDFPELPAPDGANAAVWEEIRALDEKYRITVVLYYRDGYTTQEIARILGMSQGTVKNRLYRARQKLKGRISREESL